MAKKNKKPRILIVTPEVTYIPEDMGKLDDYSAKAGGLADVSAALISALYDLNADVHVALPDYRSIFDKNNPKTFIKEIDKIIDRLDDDRVHLAEDRAFYYLNNIYSGYSDKDLKVSLAFQREVINNIIPRVKPDIIHCNDWMTGLIPAMAKQFNIPCLFTIHNIHTITSTMAEIEDRGIDAASFWNQLYFMTPPYNYEESRNWNKVDFLTSGIFSAHYVNTVSHTFLMEIIAGKHPFVEPQIKQELTNKYYAQCATGIINAPDPEFNPAVDEKIRFNYGPKNHHEKKIKNKEHLQFMLDLEVDKNAPLLFWPSRLDPVQKGCQLLADVMYNNINFYHDINLQIVVVASGSFDGHFRDIVKFHSIEKNVVICDFNEDLSHQAFASSDFILMPSSFEPCGLPQMIGCIYGALPIVFDTGGLHDTIKRLDIENNTGNGFLFNIHNSDGLQWAIDKAMEFYKLDNKIKETQINRIMIDSVLEFNHTICAGNYINLYEKMLKRPFIV
ncbi:MAG: glycogen/starch synthase [Desulfobacterales bacterium]|nr:glycogen/starch synthase [Desulfobacterales bacterium]